jgi:mannose-6-phosphate isomerase-like protein (cupin superfamily)
LFTVPPSVATAQPPPPGATEYDAILDDDGFHATDTVDTIVVISGEVWVELETTEVRLGPGDVLVQTGTRHAWRNRGDGWPLVAAFIVGAERLPAGDSADPTHTAG